MRDTPGDSAQSAIKDPCRRHLSLTSRGHTVAVPSIPSLPWWARLGVICIVLAAVAGVSWLFGSAVVNAVEGVTASEDAWLAASTAFALVLFLALSATVGLLLAPIGLTPRVLVCWVVVAVSLATLVALAGQESETSASFNAPTIGAYARSEDGPFLGHPRFVVHPDGTIEVDSPAIGGEGEDRPRIVLYFGDIYGAQVQRFLPQGCRSIERDLYDCPAGNRFTIPGFIEPLNSALTERVLALQVARSRAAFSSLELTIEFPTYELDPRWQDPMSLDHVVAGNAAVTSGAIEFRSQDQMDASQWTAAIALRLNGAASAFSILRDLLLVILGGAVTLTLRPRGALFAPEIAGPPASKPPRSLLSSRPESHQRRKRRRRSI